MKLVILVILIRRREMSCERTYEKLVSGSFFLKKKDVLRWQMAQKGKIIQVNLINLPETTAILLRPHPPYLQSDLFKSSQSLL